MDSLCIEKKDNVNTENERILFYRNYLSRFSPRQLDTEEIYRLKPLNLENLISTLYHEHNVPNLLLIILSEFVQSDNRVRTSSTLQKLISPYKCINLYIMGHIVAFSKEYEKMATILNRLHKLKFILCFSINKEQQLCTSIFNFLWGVLGYVSEYFPGQNMIRPFKIHVLEQWKILHSDCSSIIFFTDPIKRSIKAKTRNKTVIHQNSNVVHVPKQDILHFTHFAQNPDFLNDDSSDRKTFSCLAAFLQLCCGCRFHELFLSSFIFIPSVGQQDLQLPLNDYENIDDSRFFAVFRYGKGNYVNEDFERRVKYIQEKVNTLNLQLDDTYVQNTEYALTYTSIMSDIHNLMPGLPPSTYEFHKRVQLIPAKPLLFLQPQKFISLLTRLRNFVPKVDCDYTNYTLKHYFKKKMIFTSCSESLTTHKFRYIYANLTFAEYAAQECSRNRWIQIVLGHSGENIQTSLTYQTFVASEEKPDVKTVCCSFHEEKIRTLEIQVKNLKKENAFLQQRRFVGKKKKTITITNELKTLCQVSCVDDLKTLHSYLERKQFYLCRDFCLRVCFLQHEDISKLLGALVSQLLEEKPSDCALKNDVYVRNRYCWVSPRLVFNLHNNRE